MRKKIFYVFIFTFFSCSPSNSVKFLEEIGICTSISNAEILAQHGYTYIEESVGSFLMPAKSEEEFNLILQKLNDLPIPVKACNSFIPGSLKSVGPDAVHSKILEYVEAAFRRAEKAGVEYIVFGSGGSRNIPEGFSSSEARKQFISLCSQIAPIAAKYNVTVVLEPLNKKECNFINSVIEGGEIVEQINHPSFRLLADIYHMLMDNESAESIIKYGHLIKHVHIAEKEKRSAPGTYKEDLQINLIDDALKYTRLGTKLLKEADMQNSYADFVFVKARQESHSFMASNLRSLSVNMGRTYFYFDKALNTIKKNNNKIN